VDRDGAEPDLALVDAAVTRERFVGARALWRHDALSEVFVTFADPGAVGLSAVAGLLEPVARGAGRGLHVRLARDPAEAAVTLHVPLAPGLVVPVAVASYESFGPGVPIALDGGGGAIALDGEREIERAHEDGATVRLADGPWRIDVDRVMANAAAAGATHMQPAAR
jgi:hypothetical protein